VILKKPEDKNLLNQIVNVLRFKNGDKLIVFPGNEKDYILEVFSLNKKATFCKVIFSKDSVLRNKTKINIAFSVLKKENTELVLQKCTELGINEFTPLITDRTIKTGWNFERENKILIESIEQSGYGSLPTIPKEVVKMDKYLESEIRTLSIEKIRSGVNIYVLDFGGNNINTLLQNKNKMEKITFIIGPEGGFSEREKELFLKYNLPIISFGNNTLRGETAAIAIAAIMQNV
jgi:16S rRNA (uracil1498-N3)-methyltransferase